MNYFKESVDAIEEFSKRFRKNPWDYLYESDVQFELMHCLKAKINNNDLKDSSGKGINAIKSEYKGVSKIDGSGKIIPRRRFDLVAIDPAISKLDICDRPVAIAIELKLNISNIKIDDYVFNVLEKDVSKLRDCGKEVITTAGFAILCIKPYPQEDDLFDKAIKILTEDPERFKLTPISLQSENQQVHSEPLRTYAVIIDGKENGSNQYFKLT